jgi:hypothetical protein
MLWDWDNSEYSCPRTIRFNFHLALELPEAFANSSQSHTRRMQLNFGQAFGGNSLSGIPNFNVNGIVPAQQANRRDPSSRVSSII